MFNVDQELPASQIIMNDARSKAEGAEQIILMVNDLVQSGKAILLKKHNTVLVVTKIGNNEVDVHLYTLDPPHRLAAAMKYFHDELLRSGIQKAYGTEMPDKNLIKLMLAAGIPVDKSDKPGYYWMGVVK
jgi:hypothetical protein